MNFPQQQQQSFDESFNCTNGCESANQCEFNNGSNNYVAYQPSHYNQQIQPPQQQFFTAAANNECVNSNNNYEDGVVPSNSFENGYQQQMHLIQPNNYVASNNQFNNYYYGVNSDINAAGSSVTSYDNNPNMNGSDNYSYQSYVPCRGPRPWNFAECFGFYGEAPCQYANVAVDMEDFM